MGVRGAAVLAAALLLPAVAGAYQTNGRRWPAMPIPYWVNPAGAPDFGDGSTADEVIADAAAAWAGAPCAAVAFEARGTTDAAWGPDGFNTIYFVDHDWGFGSAAAGATLWRPTLEGEPMEVDLALNAVDFRWVPGGGDATRSDVVDPRAVITHELGHWLGLAHSAERFATMYQVLLPSGVQATLAGDDVAGICTLYPNGQPGCPPGGDCGPDRACRTIGGLDVCDDLHDPTGAPCDKDHLDCDGMCFISLYECGAVCAFTAVDYSAGYCAPLCDAADGCPDGWACNPIPGQAEAKVCLLEPAVADGGGDDVGGAGDAGPVDEGGPGGEVATAEVGGDVPVADDPGSSDPGTPAADAGRDDAGGGSAGGGCRAGAAPVVAWPWMLLAGWAVSRGRRKTPPD